MPSDITLRVAARFQREVIAGPKPATPSQVNYLKHLIQQVGGDEPDWSKLTDAEASALIAGLKSQRGKPVWYGNGQFSHWEKMALRVVAQYKSKKKVKTQDGEEMTVYEYSDRQVANRNKKKAERIEKLRKNIGKLRAKVKKDLHSQDPEKTLLALAVALMDCTYERVGNDESAKDGHFGVTGWRKKHVSISSKGATIKYVGKSNVKHEKKVTDPAIRTALKDAYEAVENDDDEILSWDGGRVTAEKVNDYLGQFDITAKDIRGFHANREVQERLKKARKAGGKLPEDKKKRAKTLKDEFKEALEEAADAVGHEPSTLRSQYLVPGLEESYLEDGTVSDKFGSDQDFSEP